MRRAHSWPERTRQYRCCGCPWGKGCTQPHPTRPGTCPSRTVHSSSGCSCPSRCQDGTPPGPCHPRPGRSVPADTRDTGRSLRRSHSSPRGRGSRRCSLSHPSAGQDRTRSRRRLRSLSCTSLCRTICTPMRQTQQSTSLWDKPGSRKIPWRLYRAGICPVRTRCTWFPSSRLCDCCTSQPRRECNSPCRAAWRNCLQDNQCTKRPQDWR